MFTVSVVIPVYNEEDVIEACLEHIAAQTRAPDECIVVDNNCTDRTIAVAESFADRLPIRIVTAPRQGVVWARDAGFDASSADIIGRIDADTRLDPNWCKALAEFMTARPDVAAVTGFDYLYDVPRQDRLENRQRRNAARFAEGREAFTLAGNNMAIRRTAWESVRSQVPNLPGTHEDIDLYFTLCEADAVVWVVPGMLAAVSPRRFRLSPWANREYRAAAVRTTKLHGRRRQAVFMVAQSPLLYTSLLIWWVRVKPFDPETRTWRPWRLFAREDKRKSPMTTDQD
ncbi:glycosyltransferase [Gordonia sp. SID5947]|uniref:glycosyltransferase n=1 Tax=Gordonia sp. SID5947 TaxID=2690315 RepID=UPI001371FD05|nr:glycosyltransferase family A protein [Gordonia sp. SID5947]MYR08773.1 glycosyltransferase [Gordonia sp. SID5947]